MPMLAVICTRRPAIEKGRFQLILYPFGDSRGVGGIPDAIQKHCEFVSTKSRQRISSRGVPTNALMPEPCRNRIVPANGSQ